MLNRIHYGDTCFEICKDRTREILFWSGMSKEVENLILNCKTCLSYRKSTQKEPLMPKEFLYCPWEVLGTDFLPFQGREHLIEVDYFTKYV